MTDRRGFVRGAAGTFFIAAAGSAFGLGAASNRVMIAVVGCRKGARGFQLMTQAVKLAGVEISVVCDVDARARADAAAFVRAQTGKAPAQEKDFRKVIARSDVDAVISATPDHFHAYSAVMAMRAGKHVYVEKPCAYCPQECEIILKTWRETGKVFQMGAQRRSAAFNIDAIAAICEGSLIGKPRWGKAWYMTQRGPIGRGKATAVPEWLDWDLWQGPAPREVFRDNIVPYNWHWFRKWGTGESGNNAVHFFDIARWCMGIEDYPVRVTSGGGRLWIPSDTDWEWPDTQNATFEYADGKMITWEGASCTAVKPYRDIATGAMVYGDKGAAMFLPSGDVELFDNDGKSVRFWDSAGGKGGVKITDTNDRSGGSWHDSTGTHIEDFVTCIRNDTPQLARANAEIGVKSTYLALAANVAQLTGETLHADPKTGRPPCGSAAEKLWSREYEKGWEVA